jgi:hypothetical protein
MVSLFVLLLAYVLVSGGLSLFLLENESYDVLFSIFDLQPQYLLSLRADRVRSTLFTRFLFCDVKG